jgi:hypothetical protein
LGILEPLVVDWQPASEGAVIIPTMPGWPMPPSDSLDSHGLAIDQLNPHPYADTKLPWSEDWIADHGSLGNELIVATL